MMETDNDIKNKGAKMLKPTEKSIIKRMVSGFDRRVAVKAIRSNRSIVQLFYDLTLEEAIEKLNGKL